MVSFKKFFSNLENNTLKLPPPKKLKADLAEKINISLACVSVFKGPEQAQKEMAESFSHNVSELVHGEKFVDEFSNKIGIPKESETEDEFVERAKKIMKEMIREKLR